MKPLYIIHMKHIERVTSVFQSTYLTINQIFGYEIFTNREIIFYNLNYFNWNELQLFLHLFY